jgi:hypothetical protein
MTNPPGNRRAGAHPDPLAADIGPGLVLHLDPDTLEDEGATFTGAPENRVEDFHFFVCVSHWDGAGEWLPLFPRPGTGRIKLPAEGRNGHRKWTEGSSYYHRDQLWSASDAAVKAAAKAGGDLSKPGQLNRLDPALLPARGDPK